MMETPHSVSASVVPINENVFANTAQECWVPLAPNTLPIAKPKCSMDETKLGFAQILDDIRFISQLVDRTSRIQNNTRKLLNSARGFTAQLNLQGQRYISKLQTQASQVLSQEAPTATYLLICNYGQYATIATALPTIIRATTEALEHFVAYAEAKQDPQCGPAKLDKLGGCLSTATLIPFAGKSCTSSKLLTNLIAALDDDSRVGAPVEEWLAFDTDLTQYTLNYATVRSLKKWIEIAETTSQKVPQYWDPTDELLSLLVNRLNCIALLSRTHRMMCTHLHNLVVAQFQTTRSYYDALVEELKALVVDYQSIISRAEAIVLELQHS